jgi:hypothetical protein
MPGSVRTARNIFAFAAGVLLTVFATGAWILPEDIGELILAVACTSVVCTLMCWLADRQHTLGSRSLVREMVDAYMEEQEPKTRPALRRVP